MRKPMHRKPVLLEVIDGLKEMIEDGDVEQLQGEGMLLLQELEDVGGAILKSEMIQRYEKTYPGPLVYKCLAPIRGCYVLRWVIDLETPNTVPPPIVFTYIQDMVEFTQYAEGTLVQRTNQQGWVQLEREILDRRTPNAYAYCGVAEVRRYRKREEALAALTEMGFDEDEIDDVKRMFKQNKGNGRTSYKRATANKNLKGLVEFD